MNSEKLETCISECKRFLKKAKQLKERQKKESTIVTHLGYSYRMDVFWGCKESGAVRRSSMDLSNTLADLRKTN